MATPDELLRVLVERSPVGQFVADLDGTVVLANQAYADLLERPLDEVVGIAPPEVIHPDDLPVVEREGRRLLRGEVDRTALETRHLVGDRVRWVASTTSIVAGPDGRPRWFVTFVEDVTERRAAADALRGSEDLFRMMADTVPVGLFRCDTEGLLQYANRQWEEIVGRTSADWAGRSILDLVHHDDRERVGDAHRRAEGRGSITTEYRVERPDGSLRWVSTRCVTLVDADGTISGWVGSLQDVTVLRAAQEATRRLALIAESTTDLVGVVDADGALVYMNPAARRIHGFVDRDPHGFDVRRLYTRESNERLLHEVLPRLFEGQPWSGELDMYRADGSVMKVWQTLAPELGPDGRLRTISGVGRDVTEQKRTEAALAHQATHDALTGLPNRSLLLEHVEVAVRRAARRGDHVALLFIDLDRFKEVNDGFGHDAGDELLREIGRRLLDVVRSVDVVARLGGDEFVVLCGEVRTVDETTAIAQRVLDALCAPPYRIAGADVAVTASIGVAVLEGAAAEPETLLREADAAMYRAKANGRARIETVSTSA